jgi:hypothetical protein
MKYDMDTIDEAAQIKVPHPHRSDYLIETDYDLASSERRSALKQNKRNTQTMNLDHIGEGRLTANMKKQQ